MRRQAIVTVVLSSFVSFGLCMALFAPVSLQADGPAGPGAIARPGQTITTTDYELELKLADQEGSETPLRRISVEPGRAPHMQIVATNTSSKTIKINPDVRVNSTPLASMFSRTARQSTEIWSYTTELSLDAGKSRTIDVPCDIELNDATMVTVVLSDGTNRVSPVILAVKAQNAPAGSVAAR